MKILVALSTFGGPIRAQLIDRLNQAGLTPIFNPLGRTLKADEVMNLAKECVGIIAGLEPLNRTVLESLPQLRCISRVGVGVDNVDLAVAAKRKIDVLITPDAPTQAVAELTIGLIFSLLRNIPQADQLIRKNAWKRLKGKELAGKTVGIVGLGRIGKRVAETMISLKTKVVAFDPKPDQAWAKERGIQFLSLPELLKGSDIVSVHASKKLQDPPLIGQAELTVMKPSALLVNVSRGGAVDETALVEALKTKKIAGCAMDVFEKEPYNGPLCELENVVLTAHMGSFTDESREQMEIEAVDNLIRSLQ